MAKDPDRDLIDRIDSAISEEIRETLEKVLVTQLKPIIAKLDRIEKTQVKQEKSIKKLQKTLDLALKVFNKEDMRLYKRIRRIEGHLGLPAFE